jgi:BirA family transcriptional regulator, biotin operon repressor / biotin---[acetyl-CoA-carboxylase] ligase
MLEMAPPAPVLARIERFARTGSTNDVIRGWLAAGEPEVCLAIAGEQTAGRGRLGRTWQAPPGAALLLSAGFRPTWLAPGHAWRLAAVVALAMCDAAEDAAGLPVGSVRLKWPNDLVVEVAGPRALLLGPLDAAEAAARLAAPLALRKLAGVLGETEGLGTPDPRVVVGIGINVAWAAKDFPAELVGTMTSLHEASGGRPVDADALLDGFTDRLEARVEALRAGFFDLAGWTERQATTGRLVTLEAAGETTPAAVAPVRALGMDAASGALIVEDPSVPAGERLVHAGEVVGVRLAAGQV